MSDTVGVRSRFGDGPLSRVAAFVYTLLAVELLLLATTIPSLVVFVLLEPDASNIPLVALCAVPLGPAIAAALYALRHRSRDITELKPARAFWRGYRLNLRSSLLIWAPGIAWLGIVAIGLTNFSATGLPAWWVVLLGLVGAGALLWLVNALVIASLFTFRARDVARLAAYFLTRTPGVTLGNAGMLIIATGITLLTSEAVLALLGSVLVLMLLQTCRPLIAAVTAEFTR